MAGKKRLLPEEALARKRARARAYYWAHREKCQAQKIAWVKANPERLRIYSLLYNRKYFRKYPEKYRASSRKYNAKLRAAVLAAYGNKCACCGETEPLFLGVDHLRPGDRRRLRQEGGGGHKIYVQVRREGYPTDIYQLLCHNCNLAKGFYGLCPHQRTRNGNQAN